MNHQITQARQNKKPSPIMTKEELSDYSLGLTRISLSRILAEETVIIVVFLFSIFTSSINYYITSIFLVLVAFTFYFYYALKSDKNFLDFKAVFLGSWLFTIGLAQLKLCGYQLIWDIETWICLMLAPMIFIFFNYFSHKTFPNLENKYNLKKMKLYRLKVKYEFQQNRLFWICIVSTLIGITCFVINIYIRGYVPFFVSTEFHNAYSAFYTRFHIFTVASMASAGLSYYCIKKCNLSLPKKILLYSSIIILVFIIPIMVVSRGVFMCVALILISSVYFLNRKRFIVLFLCIIVMLGVYEIGSIARGYTDDYLNYVFKPKEIVITSVPVEPSEPDKSESTRVFKLPSKVAFLYSYLTIGHDNFDYAVKNQTGYTYGLRQLSPFNTIIRSSWIKAKLEEAEFHMVSQWLNVINLIGFAYYDLGIIGIVLLIAFWSFIFGIIEASYLKYQGPVGGIVYGNCLTPIALGFFSSWMSVFTFWMFWGTALIFFVISNFSIVKGEQHDNSSSYSHL